MSKTCPACGATALQEKEQKKQLSEPFGGRQEIIVKEYICETCGSSGDFFDENDAVITNAMEKLKHNAVENILDDFAENKISMSAMERALSLPQRTLTKWKNGASIPSASGIALLKYLRTFPWLLEVAENNFDYSTAQRIHINTGIKSLLHELKFSRSDLNSAGIIDAQQSTYLFFEFHGSGSVQDGSQIRGSVSNNQQVYLTVE